MYAFNKSHSTCYAFIAYQTAYLKAHYPEDFMASVLNHNKNDISKINFFLRECKRMGIVVLGPDINESKLKFAVNAQRQIRFGLSALKGVGEGPVEAIGEARKEGGAFENIFDMARRLNLRAVNKKCFESLALGGAFDSFEAEDRAQYFSPSGSYDTLLEHAIKYGQTYQLQKEQNQVSLFGDTEDMYVPEPEMPEVHPWSAIEKLEKEKEVTGIYISGHPLDDYEMEIRNYTNCPLEKAEEVREKQLKLAGLVTDVFHGVSQKGTGYTRFTIQDYTGALQVALYNEQYENWKNLIFKGNVLYIDGMNLKRFNADRYFFKVKEIRMLDSVGQMLTKSITLKLPINALTDNLLEKLELLCNEHKGEHKFKMKVIDSENEIGLDLVSKSFRINATSQFVKELEIMGLPYRLN